MTMTLSDSLCVEIDMVSINSLLTQQRIYGNQKPFDKMILMQYEIVGIGVVKMTVGVRRRSHEKVQYCITAFEV